MSCKTSDECREVAARLRSCAQDVNGTRDFAMYLSHWVGFDGVTDDEGKHFTIAANRREAERTLEKLADLVDPTCYPVIPDEEEGYVFCSNCGAEIGEYGVPNYCHNCGHRLVSNYYG